jgi:V/A-type H+-transporting ATPase subunit I
VILEMDRVRILGPIAELQAVLSKVQDIGLVHLDETDAEDPLEPLGLTREQRRHARMVTKAATDVHASIAILDGRIAGRAGAVSELSLAKSALIAGRTRRALERIEERRRDLEEERALILKFRPFFATFRKISESGLELDSIRVFYLVLREGGAQELQRVRRALRETLGNGFELIGQPSTSGETATILAVPKESGAQAERLLNEAGVQSLSLPDQFEEGSAGATIQRMQARLEQLPKELEALDDAKQGIADERGPELLWIRSFLEDRLATLAAMEKASVTKRAFVLEGWIPRGGVTELRKRLQADFHGMVEVEVVSSEEWTGDTAPVVLRNPRLFRPFETITKMMPLPKYGTIDPTPFVAIFFPMFFGIALGDIGYGAILGLVSLILRLRSKPSTTLRSISEIGLACALFTMIFGFLYGELLGDLGHKIGLHPIIFNREEAFFPFLGLAVALGIVHVVIGLLLGAVQLFRRNKRHAIGRGLAAVMVLLIVAALMAAADMLPERFFTPLVITALVALPVLVVAEGVLAPVELVSTLGNVLSYARIMAVGTASVMMAVVANRMVGALGGVVVGVLCALLFHLINFVLGVFSPTIHMLRLHYVEFFGKFFSPGGFPYQPFRHWSPREDAVENRST